MNKIGNNLSIKLPNKTAPNVQSSFVNLPKSANQVANQFVNTANQALNTANQALNTAYESVNRTANTAANTVSNAMSDFTSPINESIQGSFNSETSPFLSIPIVVGLGILIIVMILIVKFRHQIALLLDRSWHQAKGFADSLFGAHHAPPAPPSPHVDHDALQKMMPPPPSHHKEVFNIAANKYTYTDAEPLCKAFGAELATYDQVKEAWNKGADWCNYGWVKGQSAVYPTQQETYDKLQAGPEDQRMACGTAGVNGGYFDNPELRMGVNCYGKKPTENDTDDRYHAKQKNLTPGALAYDQKVQNYKNEQNQIPVNPFKTGSWNA